LPATLRATLSPHYDVLFSSSVEEKDVRDSALVVLADGHFLQFVASFKEADPPVPSIVIVRTEPERHAAIYAGAADLFAPDTDPGEILTKIETVMRLSENRASLEERARLDNVLDAMSDGIVLLGPDLRIQRLNEKAKMLLGAAAGGDDFVKTLLRTYATPDAAGVAKRLLAGPVAFDAERPETPELRPLVLEVRTNLVRDWMRETRGVVLVLSDVTERRRRSAQEEEFLNLISHKLRTPMAIVHKNASMFQQKVLGPMTPDQERFMGVLYEKCCELVDSFEKLLGFTMLKSRALDLPPERIVLAEALPARLEAYFGRKRAKKAEWTVAVPDASAAVFIHPKYFDLILQNVLENALKFGDKDPVRVEVKAEADAQDVVLTVRDNGPGIPPEDREKVFEAFYQVDRDRTLNVAGTGLGLAISRRIAEAHGGRLSLESSLGQGTAFRLTLPYAPALPKA
jgi:signal transduction histidine kinase